MGNDICVRFGHRLRLLREKKGWTQEEFAHRANSDQGSISRFELGRQEPGLYTLEDFAGAFDMTVSQLMRGV